MRLQIQVKRIHFLQSEDGVDIALVNTQTARALQKLDDLSLARYTPYVSMAEWAEKTGNLRTSGKTVYLDMDLYLFGLYSNGMSVGRILSDNGLFLQQPDMLDSSIPYENPHEIKFESMSISDLPLTVPPLEAGSTHGLSADTLTRLLDNLTQQGNLKAADVDTSIVITALKL